MSSRRWTFGALAVVFFWGGSALADDWAYEGPMVQQAAFAPDFQGSLIRGQQPPPAAPMIPGACPPGVACMDPGAGCGDPCWGIYGDVLLLRPGNDKVAYAVPINGAIIPPVGAPPVQVGPEALVDWSYDIGFRLGAWRSLNECSSLGVAFAWYESDRNSNAAGDALNPLRSLVYHPGSVAAASDYLAAVAGGRIEFQIADVEYRRFISTGAYHTLNYVAGARYVHLEEVFRSTFSNAVLIEDVNTDINFDGGGIRFGLEGERQAVCSGLLVYAKTYASFLTGQFVNRYTQADSASGLVVNTGWTEDRVVTILDAELGLGWQSVGGGLRLTAGYTFSGWFNVINTDDFIRAVRRNDSVSVSDTLTFDGLVFRAELRF